MIRPPIPWSDDEDAELRRIYALSSCPAAKTALKIFSTRKGVTRQACRNRAGKLHLTRMAGGHKVWTEEERNTLRFYRGVMPAWKIAKIMHRSEDSVKSQLYLMEIGTAVRERGYTRKDLADLMGMDLGYTLRRFLRKYPMPTNGIGNFSKSAVQLWIWDHLDDLELRKFDQLWLKDMLRRAA